jgi:hypothetical protein
VSNKPEPPKGVTPSPGSTGYEQNPRTVGPGTVPKDVMAAPEHPTAQVPTLVPLKQTVQPAKPAANTGQGAGPSGTSISIPKAGKDGA